MTSIALAIVGNAARSQEVVQDSYLAAWTGLRTLRSPAKFAAWLGGIVRNQAKSARRRERPAVEKQAIASIAESGAATPLDAIVEGEDARCLEGS